MDAAGKIDLLHYGKSGPWWFTHTPAEGIQYLRALAAEIDIPAELRRLVCETTLELPDDLASTLPQVDAVVVELSTFKTLEVDSYRLNFQNVHRYAREAGVPPRDVVWGVPVDWPDSHQLLIDMVVGKATSTQVHDELLEIRDRVGAPMLTVDHLYATTDSGDLVPGRDDLTAALNDLEATAGVPFHSTRPIIERFGEQVALQDSNHYRADFEETAGDALLESLQELLSR